MNDPHDNTSLHQASNDTVILFGPFSLRPRPRTLSRDGKEIAIGDRAFDLMLALIEARGDILSKSDLLEKVWPGMNIDEGNLRVHISLLRKILGKTGDGHPYIRNIAGRGYCFVSPVDYTDNGSQHTVLGRDNDIALISRLLEERKLVSIVGPGGVGKTTVATMITHKTERSLGIATAIVDFSTISDPDLVPSSLAAAIGASVLLRQPLDSVINALRGKRKLLLLDNCEHILGAATALVESVRAVAPDILILLTSREPLKAEGEWVYRLAPLRVPQANSVLPIDEALRYASIQLFVARAQLHHTEFTLTSQNCDAICKICRMLDGLPLAIELAAAQVKFKGIDRLLDELKRGFDVPDESHRLMPAVHQSLKPMLDWSYDALGESEKRILGYLSTFRGYFDFEAAQTVACDNEVSHHTFLQGFFHLIETSIISVGTDSDPPLYRLLDVTRAYASGKLALTDRKHEACRKHALYFLKFLTSEALSTDSASFAPIRGRGTSHSPSLPRRIIDDIRSALDWSFLFSENTTLACHLTISSSYIWQQLALLSEYQQYAIRALRHIKKQDPTLLEESLELLLAVGFTDAGGANLPASTSKTGRQAFRSALAYAEQTLAIESQIDALYGLVVLQVKAGDFRDASLSVDKLGALADASPHAAALYHRLKALVDAYTGRVAPALEELDKAQACYAEIDDVWKTKRLGRFNPRCALTSMKARLLWEAGFPDDALAACQESAQYAVDLGDQLSLCYVLATGACPVAAWSGDLDLLSKFVAIFRKTVDEQSLVYWEQWAQTFEWGLKVQYDHAQTARADRQRFGTFTPLQHEMLATLDPRLLTAQAAQRAEQGNAGFSLPEIFRARGVTLFAYGAARDLSLSEEYLREAFVIAKRNDSPSWALRAATSLLTLKMNSPGASEAADLVNNVLAGFSQGQRTRDHVNARHLLEAMSSQRREHPARSPLLPSNSFSSSH